jgi:hypothetical protein
MDWTGIERKWHEMVRRMQGSSLHEGPGTDPERASADRAGVGTGGAQGMAVSLDRRAMG